MRRCKRAPAGRGSDSRAPDDPRSLRAADRRRRTGTSARIASKGKLVSEEHAATLEARPRSAGGSTWPLTAGNALTALGNQHAEAGRDDVATGIYERVIVLGETTALPYALVNLARIKTDTGDLERAEALLRSAIAADVRTPDDIQNREVAQLFLAGVLGRTWRMEEADQILRGLLVDCGGELRARAQLGLAPPCWAKSARRKRGWCTRRSWRRGPWPSIGPAHRAHPGCSQNDGAVRRLRRCRVPDSSAFHPLPKSRRVSADGPPSSVTIGFQVLSEDGVGRCGDAPLDGRCGRPISRRKT